MAYPVVNPGESPHPLRTLHSVEWSVLLDLVGVSSCSSTQFCLLCNEVAGTTKLSLQHGKGSDLCRLPGYLLTETPLSDPVPVLLLETLALKLQLHPGPGG